MNDIWLCQAKHDTYDLIAAPNDGSDYDPGIEVNHFIDLASGVDPNVAIGIFGGHLGADARVELILRRENFDIDYFTWGGCMFVSKRMREAMALDPSEVRYIEVDASQSAPLPRSKNYMVMEPLLMEDVLDPDRSVYWMDSIPPPTEFGPHEIYKLAFLREVPPTIDLFYDGFFATLVLCTDQFALRILEAGCTGVEFTDPRGYCCIEAPRRRTLEGIEVCGEKLDFESYKNMPWKTEKYKWIYDKLKELEDNDKAVEK